jgi:copper transport protein
MFRFLARSHSAVLTAAVLLALALPATAGAHAYLVASTPANGASLARAPHAIDLRFTEAISASLTHVQIFDANGAERLGARVRSGAGPRELRVTLPKLPTGAYRVAYSTASQVDLHATRGAIVFGAGTAAPAITAAPSAAPATDITETVAHVFDLLALSVLIAICALLASGLSALVRARIARFALVALPALLLAGVLALAGKSSQFPLRDVLFDTAWGHAMLVRELAILAVLAAAATQRRRVALVLLVPVAVAEAASGHAASLDVVATLTMAAHILAAGVWVGGLIVLALVLPGLERCVVMDSLARFGRLAAAAVAVVVVTGLYSAGRQVASLDSLLTTTYGWSLVAKVALLGATGGLGLLGLMAVRRKRPSLLLLGAEALAATGVLVAASVLLSSPPARGPQFAPAPPTIAGTTLATGQADDLLVDLSATPNRPGQNFVTVTLLDTRRPSPGTPRGVAFTFSGGTGTVTARARRLDSNRWQVAGTQLTEPGHWRIAVAVERTGLPRATYETGWTVATPLPAPGVHRARFSQRPIRPILTALAVALAAAAGVAVLWRRRQHFGIRRPRTA